jgi:hypothetical protein
MAMIPAMSAADFGTGGTAVMNYGMQVGKDLAAYGEKIGLQMKDNRDKQFAMSAIPALQEAMKSFSAGQSGAGYSSIINLAAQDPSNPYVQNLAKLGMMGGKAIDDNRYNTLRAAAAGARIPTGPSGSERLRAGQGGTGAGGTTAGGMPAMNAEFVDDGTLIPDADAVDAATAESMPKFDSAEQEEMYTQVVQFRAKSPEEQQATLAQSTTTEKPKGYESRKIDGLSNLFPNLTGDLLIPDVGTTTKIKRTVSTSDKPGSEIKESLSEVDEKVGEERYKFNIQTVNNIPAAVSAMNKQAPIGEREPFVKLFNRNGGIANAVTAPTDDPEIYSLTFQGNDKDEYSISKDQASKLTVAQSIPAISGSGIKFLASEKPTAEAPAPTQGGLPAVQPPPAAAPEIPDVEGNPFTEKVKKIKTEETEKQKKLTTDEISRVVETTNRLQQALDGLAKGEYLKVMDYLPRTKKTTLESSSLDALKNEYNVLANLKPAIEWLKKNPNHKDAPAAAEVIKQKLGI